MYIRLFLYTYMDPAPYASRIARTFSESTSDRRSSGAGSASTSPICFSHRCNIRLVDFQQSLGIVGRSKAECMHRFVHFAAFYAGFSIFMHFKTVLRYNPVNKGQKPASGKTTHCVRKGTPP